MHRRLFGFISLSLFFLSGCAFNKDALKSALRSSCSSQLFSGSEAFVRTLHPEFIRSSCVNCHFQGSSLAPLGFADATASRAYEDARRVVDFGSVDSSDIVQKVERFNHNCGSTANCVQVGQAFRAQIRAWWEQGENPRAFRCASSGGNQDPIPSPSAGPVVDPNAPRVRTAAIAVPTAISTTADTNLTWDLSQANPPISNAHLRVAIRRVVPASSLTLGSYQIRDPRLATSNARLRISKFMFVINNRLSDLDLTFRSLDFIVAPQAYVAANATWPFFRMSTTTHNLSYEQTQGDMLAIAFDIETTTNAPSPDPGAPLASDQTLFNNQVSPMLNRQCAGCHGANRGFNLSGSIDQDRLSAISYSNRTAPMTSTLYAKATGAVSHNGNNALPNAADRALLVQWMQSLPQ